MPAIPRPPQAPYRREGDTWLIEIRLHELRQLFHTLDPAPFHEKDLDPEAAQYLEDAVREIGPRRALKLLVHLPRAAAESADARGLADSLANYFRYRAGQCRVDLRRLLTRGAMSLVIGGAFLGLCLSLRSSLLAGGAASEVLTEGLLIIGWVGLWRPVEIFLYDWWPIWRQRRRFDALARAQVAVESVAG
ncbi:MAG: hypothetical protein U1F11_07740 [Steroidobacteraceae bacterium]